MDDGIVFINVLVCIELCESRNKQRYLWKYRNNPPPRVCFGTIVGLTFLLDFATHTIIMVLI